VETAASFIDGMTQHPWQPGCYIGCLNRVQRYLDITDNFKQVYPLDEVSEVRGAGFGGAVRVGV
jgi:hypothetical protein